MLWRGVSGETGRGASAALYSHAQPIELTLGELLKGELLIDGGPKTGGLHSVGPGARTMAVW